MAKAIVVYDSKYGNTEKTAKAIAEGIEKGGMSAECISVNAIDPQRALSHDLMVLGGPTHMGGATRAMKKFIKAIKGEEVAGKRAVAFDTRLGGVRKGALDKIEALLNDLGIEIVASGLAVTVGGIKGPLKEGELERCVEFGLGLAER